MDAFYAKRLQATMENSQDGCAQPRSHKTPSRKVKWVQQSRLQGPRVLGRTGLAWGAKGPGPDRLGFGLGAKGPGPDRLGFRPFRPSLGGGAGWGGWAYVLANARAACHVRLSCAPVMCVRTPAMHLDCHNVLQSKCNWLSRARLTTEVKACNFGRISDAQHK